MYVTQAQRMCLGVRRAGYLVRVEAGIDIAARPIRASSKKSPTLDASKRVQRDSGRNRGIE